MSDNKFHRTGDNEWTSNEERGYTAVITYTEADPEPYALEVTGLGTFSGTYPTMKTARDGFRTFLLDKPVTVPGS